MSTSVRYEFLEEIIMRFVRLAFKYHINNSAGVRLSVRDITGEFPVFSEYNENHYCPVERIA